MIHVAGQSWYNTNINSFEWKVFNVYDSAVRWAVPVFVMISGVLFLTKDYSIKTIYSKKIFRIFVAFVFWSLIYLFFSNKSTNKFEKICKLLTGEYHMWFLFMIIGLYMLSPVLKKITETKKITKYFLIITFMLSIFLPQIAKLLLLFKNKYINIISKAITANLGNFKLNIGYTYYFVLGYYLSKAEIKKTMRYTIYFLGIISFLSTIILTNIASIKAGKPSETYYGNMSLNVALEALSLFVFAKYNFKTNKFLNYCSKICFGVYLSHILFLENLNILMGINTMTFNPIASVPIITIIVFVMSLLLSGLINNIPILKRYIV